MSAELPKARQQLSQVRTLLRQEKVLPAVQGVQSALLTLLKGQFIKTERQEFEELLRDAMAYLANDATVRKVYPLQLAYAPGQERECNETLKDLIRSLHDLVAEDAQEQLRLREERKRALLALGKAQLEAGEAEKGLQTLVVLGQEFSDDPILRGEMGKILLDASQYAAAVEYLQHALEINPELLPLYNLIAIALRKLDRFETAEQYFLRAAEYMRMDPNLYFNIGRLYVDWKKWGKAAKAAQAALRLKPDFVEAHKLLAYAEGQLQAEGNTATE
ncbi:MAG: tetratricopeptide repeat protein [Deltaproteobacteria bacterium]|jgi:tetratricopeptide (TPR) repeat protein|nr:tetratricopeptide repeat protein [Deltaproteobacteria bacterium]